MKHFRDQFITLEPHPKCSHRGLGGRRRSFVAGTSGEEFPKLCMAGNILDLHVYKYGCNEPGGWKLVVTPVPMVTNPAMIFFLGEPICTCTCGNVQLIYTIEYIHMSRIYIFFPVPSQ